MGPDSESGPFISHPRHPAQLKSPAIFRRVPVQAERLRYCSQLTPCNRHRQSVSPPGIPIVPGSRSPNATRSGLDSRQTALASIVAPCFSPMHFAIRCQKLWRRRSCLARSPPPGNRNHRDLLVLQSSFVSHGGNEATARSRPILQPADTCSPTNESPGRRSQGFRWCRGEGTAFRTAYRGTTTGFLASTRSTTPSMS